MGWFSKRRATPQGGPEAHQDPFAPTLAASYGVLVSRSTGRAAQRGVLRLVTGGPLNLTRPIAVSWNTGAGPVETYRGDPNFDGPAMADTQAQATFQRFDREVERLVAAGWRLCSIEGRNLIFERD